MFIRKSRKKPLANGSPLLHQDHGKPRTRREVISQGLMAGSATLFGASVFSLFANPRQAAAALSSDLENLKESCGIAVSGAGKIPFICFDLAGGANITRAHDGTPAGVRLPPLPSFGDADFYGLEAGLE